MMSRKRPVGLDAAPAFDLSSVQGEVEPAVGCAARCEPMSRIEDYLYLGSWRDIDEPESLRAAGITHILNVAKEVDPTHHKCEDGFEVLHIPLVDEHRENILEHMESACTFITGAADVHGKCLVHCRRGISRSPAIVVGYMMRAKGLPFEDAVEFVKQRRNCVSLNIAFREFLMAYDTPTVRAARNELSTTFGDDGDHHTPTPGTSDGDGGCDSGHSNAQTQLHQEPNSPEPV